MSKSAKSASKEKRKKLKKARKAAQKAKYEAYKAQGINSKSRRASRKAKALKEGNVRTTSHVDGPCGNVGCTKCFPLTYKPFMKKGKPYQMPQWMYEQLKDA